jgi:hypothetical protein
VYGDLTVKNARDQGTCLNGEEISMEIKLIIECLIGYSISIGVGGVVIYYISKSARKITETDKDFSSGSEYIWATIIMGCIERFIYTTSIVFGVKEFIPAWLVVKVASQWSKWDGTKDKSINTINDGSFKGRGMYQMYLVGSGLSVIYGALGGQTIIWISNGNSWYAIISNIVVIILSLFILGSLLWIGRSKKKEGRLNTAINNIGQKPNLILEDPHKKVQRKRMRVDRSRWRCKRDLAVKSARSETPLFQLGDLRKTP